MWTKHIIRMTSASRQETLYHARIALQEMHDSSPKMRVSQSPYDFRQKSASSNHILKKYKSTDYPPSLLSSAQTKKPYPILSQHAAQFYSNPKNRNNYVNVNRDKKVHTVKPLDGMKRKIWFDDKKKVRGYAPIGAKGSFFGLPNK